MSTVLAIDDDKVMRERYKKVMKSEGYGFLEAPNALDVVNVLMRDKEKINCIILDIQMPEVDGRDIFDIVNDYAPSIPVIVSSVLPTNEQKLRIPRARGYYQKTTNDKELIKKLSEILQ